MLFGWQLKGFALCLHGSVVLSAFLLLCVFWKVCGPPQSNPTKSMNNFLPGNDSGFGVPEYPPLPIDQAGATEALVADVVKAHGLNLFSTGERV